MVLIISDIIIVNRFYLYAIKSLYEDIRLNEIFASAHPIIEIRNDLRIFKKRNCVVPLVRLK